MPIFNLFSKRQKRLRGEVPDVYQYENIPESLRIQIIHILNDSFGQDSQYVHIKPVVSQAFKQMHKILVREYRVFSLTPDAISDRDAIYIYFLTCKDYEQVLDIIELSFRVINVYLRESTYQNQADSITCAPDDAIYELNQRFKEHGIGYQFESNADELIRVDSEFLHSETVKPVLELIGKEKRFEGVNEEFLKAHEHYRHERYKECLVDCLKSFESVMKAICDTQGWTYQPSDTAKKLINICFEKELIPTYMQSQFSSLRSLLESGVPTIRNKRGGHGQGTKKIEVSETLASYSLHLTASNILFLCNLERDKFGSKK